MSQMFILSECSYKETSDIYCYFKKNVSEFQLKHCLSHCIKEFYKVEEAHCNF